RACLGSLGWSGSVAAWRIPKISLAEILRCFEHPISEEQAWAICFQCCCKMKQLAQGLHPSLHGVGSGGRRPGQVSPPAVFCHALSVLEASPSRYLFKSRPYREQDV
uniref:KIND domain-containing protein n=1 Tax=Apteryx owenii TaxID=8824 RepID=A0A8B9NSU8_APTOW